MHRTLAAAATALLLSTAAAGAFGYRSTAADDPAYGLAMGLIAQQRYADAVPLLKQVVARNPQDADGYNELGFTARKLGDATTAKAYYGIALQLDPNHLGAIEYLGELYAETGELPKAEAQLARLATLCHGTCAALGDLQAAIQRHQPKAAG